MIRGLITGILAAVCVVVAEPFPPAADLPALAAMPDPLAAKGDPVTDAAGWQGLRPYIKAMLEHYEYGVSPPPPDTVPMEAETTETVLNGAAVLHRFVMRLGPAGELPVECGYYVPVKGDGPFPVIVAVDPVFDAHVLPTAEAVVARGYAFAGFRYLDVAPDVPERTGGVYPAYPAYDWGTIAAWAWGCSRLIDCLVARPELDATRIAVTGHSRCGKAALWCGAVDDRVALTAPHCSGEGGAGSHRVQGPKAESLALITDPERFHYWFSPRLREFAGKEDRLPFDQHFVMALVAPRALVCLEASEDLWANPSGARLMVDHAKPAYRLFGAEDRMGFYVREAGHDPTPESWSALMDFADFLWRGKALPDRFGSAEH